MIRIVNLKNYKSSNKEVLIKIDRTTSLGNPYKLPGTMPESKRDKVCDDYNSYIVDILKRYFSFTYDLTFREQRVVDSLKDIAKTAKTRNIVLGCWCFPKRCHGETIIKVIQLFGDKLIEMDNV